MVPEIDRSALIIVDMQNDFIHPEGDVGIRAREHPETGVDMPFLTGTIHPVKRLAEAFRKVKRPVIYLAHIVKPDYSDAQFPYWRFGLPRGSNRTFIVEGTWGAQIVDDLSPQEGEHVIIKKGFGGIFEYPARHHPTQYGGDDLRHIRSNYLRVRIEHRAWRRGTQLPHDHRRRCGRQAYPR